MDRSERPGIGWQSLEWVVSLLEPVGITCREARS
jgi:hypothetical protein